MKKNLMEKYPKFCNDENGIYSTILSDDIDSLLGNNLLTYIKDYKTEHFYDFKKLHSAINQNDNKPAIGIDIAIENGRCWDNHVVKVQSQDKVNPNSANINAILGFNRGNYTSKAVLSTFLQIWSYYDIPISNSREQQMILLAIDSAYLGHFNPRYKQTQRNFLEMLDMGVLIDRIYKESEESFKKVKKWLSGKIVMDKDGYLKTNLPLKQLQQYFDFPIFLPDEQFKVVREFGESKNSVELYYPFKKPDNLFSFALRNKNKMNYTKF